MSAEASIRNVNKIKYEEFYFQLYISPGLSFLETQYWILQSMRQNKSETGEIDINGILNTVELGYNIMKGTEYFVSL